MDLFWIRFRQRLILWLAGDMPVMLNIDRTKPVNGGLFVNNRGVYSPQSLPTLPNLPNLHVIEKPRP